MAASDFSCNFFRIQTSGFELCERQSPTLRQLARKFKVFGPTSQGRIRVPVAFWYWLTSLANSFSFQTFLRMNMALSW